MTDNPILETVLLLALPASGKSEVRRFIDWLSPEERRRDLHLGPSVQLDDYPYVFAMRRIDDELEARGASRMFFAAADRPLFDPRDWGTLIQLLDEDYEDLLARRGTAPGPAARHLFERIDRAAAKVGVPARLSALEPRLADALAGALEPEASALAAEKLAAQGANLAGSTLVIEFSRGGPDGASMPLDAPMGYAWSLAQLSPALLERATILYIWVTPEESRRKNDARADPSDPGSILHHGVPLPVMLHDYGTDDIDWLEAQSDRPGRIAIEASGRTWWLPLARFDNRTDKTTFVRDDPTTWPAEKVNELRRGLASAFDRLLEARRAGA